MTMSNYRVNIYRKVFTVEMDLADRDIANTQAKAIRKKIAEQNSDTWVDYIYEVINMDIGAKNE